MNLLTVVAVFKAKPGKEEALREVLLGLVDPTRSEPGCLQYDLHLSSDDPAEFVFIEKWVDRLALDVHLGKPYIEALRGRQDELMAQPAEIRSYSRLA